MGIVKAKYWSIEIHPRNSQTVSFIADNEPEIVRMATCDYLCFVHGNVKKHLNISESSGFSFWPVFDED